MQFNYHAVAPSIVFEKTDGFIEARLLATQGVKEMCAEMVSLIQHEPTLHPVIAVRIPLDNLLDEILNEAKLHDLSTDEKEVMSLTHRPEIEAVKDKLKAMVARLEALEFQRDSYYDQNPEFEPGNVLTTPPILDDVERHLLDEFGSPCTDLLQTIERALSIALKTPVTGLKEIQISSDHERGGYYDANGDMYMFEQGVLTAGEQQSLYEHVKFVVRTYADAKGVPICADFWEQTHWVFVSETTVGVAPE